MYMEKCEIFNFTGGNALYSFGLKISSILDNQTHEAKVISKWFRINTLKANPRESQFIILGKNHVTKWNSKLIPL